MKYIAILLLAILAFSSYTSAQSLDCSVCEYIVSTVEDMLQQNHTVTQIEDDLDVACSKLPSKWANNCEILVNSYAPLVINMLINKEDPDTVCYQIKVCNSTETVMVQEPAVTVSITVEEPTVVGGAIECDLCDWVVGKVESYVESNYTETQILSFLDKDCNILKNPSWVGDCTTLVNNYAPLIIQYITNKEPANTVCTKIGICTSTSKCGGKQQKVTSDPMECPICTMVVSYVEEFLTANKTEEEIIAFLQVECGKLDAKYSTICKAAVANYLPEIITYIENGKTPSQACQSLGICAAPSTVKELPKDDECTICEIVLQEVIRYMGNNQTDQEILQAIENDCSYFFSNTTVQECQSFVESWGEKIISYINSGKAPEFACDELGMCGGSSDSSSSSSSSSSASSSSSNDEVVRINKPVVPKRIHVNF